MNLIEKNERMKELIEMLNKYRDAYYNQTESLVSDYRLPPGGCWQIVPAIVSRQLPVSGAVLLTGPGVSGSVCCRSSVSFPF